MSAHTTHSQVEARVRELTPAVKRIARHMMKTLPASVEIDDVVQCGMLGLLDAARRYDSSEGAAFETYATHRIRGAIVDGLRQTDWLPRQVRSRMREVEAAISRLEQQKGKAPTEAELAEALDMPLREYQQLLQDAKCYQIVSYEDLSPHEEDPFLERHIADTKGDPLALLEARSVREALVRSIETLPKREKTVIALYYQEGLRQREIGAVLNITESRVCQILTQAIVRLRVHVLAQSRREHSTHANPITAL